MLNVTSDGCPSGCLVHPLDVRSYHKTNKQSVSCILEFRHRRVRFYIPFRAGYPQTMDRIGQCTIYWYMSIPSTCGVYITCPSILECTNPRERGISGGTLQCLRLRTSYDYSPYLHLVESLERLPYGWGVWMRLPLITWYNSSKSACHTSAHGFSLPDSASAVKLQRSGIRARAYPISHFTFDLLCVCRFAGLRIWDAEVEDFQALAT